MEGRGWYMVVPPTGCGDGRGRTGVDVDLFHLLP